MPSTSILPRNLYSLLDQIFTIIRSRDDPALSFLPDAKAQIAHQHRCYIEWLCDNNVEELRRYIYSSSHRSHAVTPAQLPPRLTWQFQANGSNTLCYQRRPLILFLVANVSEIRVDEEEHGSHHLRLLLSPLAVLDVLGLERIASFARPRDRTLPRQIAIATVLDQDSFFILDAENDSAIGWDDIICDEYLLVELSVQRRFSAPGQWCIEYVLLAATRIASVV